jgi:hypothetical protein
MKLWAENNQFIIETKILNVLPGEAVLKNKKKLMLWKAPANIFEPEL